MVMFLKNQLVEHCDFMELDMEIHCHCTAVVCSTDDLVEMDVCKCKNGWFAVFDHWGDGGYIDDDGDGERYVAKFLRESDAYLFVYRRLRDIHGKIKPCVGAGCPNNFLKELEVEITNGLCSICKSSEKEICSICEEKLGDLYVGGPVRCMCPSCARIIHKFFELKEKHVAFMRRTKEKISKSTRVIVRDGGDGNDYQGA